MCQDVQPLNPPQEGDQAAINQTGANSQDHGQTAVLIEQLIDEWIHVFDVELHDNSKEDNSEIQIQTNSQDQEHTSPLREELIQEWVDIFNAALKANSQECTKNTKQAEINQTGSNSQDHEQTSTSKKQPIEEWEISNDSKEIALGDEMDKKQYMLVPAKWKIQICDVKNVGKDLAHFNLSDPLIAGVYALAKAQAAELGLNKTKQRKWATLRMVAFELGWFDNQRYTMRKEPPPNYVNVLLKDFLKIQNHLKAARNICLFIPFLNEFFFRSFGKTSSDLTEKFKFVTSQIKGMSHFLPADELCGPVLQWIDIKRPMLVIKANFNNPIIPEFFRARARSSPIGQTLITAADAICKSLESSIWWKMILNDAEGCKLKFLTSVADKIKQDPWKYHTKSGTYDLPALTTEEVQEIEEARKVAIKYAPILQAYVDVVKAKTHLGRIKVLKKHSDKAKRIYLIAKVVFNSAAKLQSANAQFMFNFIHGYLAENAS